MSEHQPAGAALITGASSGIGAVYADRLARRGHDLILVARDARRLDAVAARLRAEAGVRVDVLKADLTVKSDLLAVERRLREDDSIDVLVNNAGIAAVGALVSADPDQLDAMLDLNIGAVTRLAVAAASVFAARRRGTIINLSSVTTLIPERFNGAYSGSKAYVLNLSQALCQELAERGVRVQAVLPGATRTEIWARAGVDIDQLDPAMVMGVDEMVDAALAGLDAGELVTIPALPDAADWQAFTDARLKLAPNLSRDRAAARYKALEAA